MPVHSDALEDALRVQAEEHLAQAVVLRAEQAVGGHLDVVEEEEELLLGRADLHRDEGALDAGRFGVDDEQGQAGGPGVLVDAGARDHEHRVGLVDAGDVGLGAAEPVDVAVAPGGGREVVAVGARVGLGDREHHLPTAAETREPARALLAGTEARDQLGADPGRHQHEEQRTSLRGELLAHHHELAQAATTAAVLLGQVHREESGLGDGLPQLLGLPAGDRALVEVLVSERRRDPAHGRPKHHVLVGLGELHRVRVTPRRRAA